MRVLSVCLCLSVCWNLGNSVCVYQVHNHDDHYHLHLVLNQHIQKRSTNMATSNYLLSSSPPVRFKSSIALVCLLQSVLIFTVSRTAGVTHWKLQDNAITPAATDLSGSAAQQDDLFAMSLPTTDPEFAVLLRHATKVPSGSATGNRGTVRSGSNRACPVVSITLDSGDVPQGGERGCSTGGGVGKSTGVSPETVGSCGRQQRGCRSGSGSGGMDERSVNSGGGVAGGDESGTTVKQPRNPDGSGPM